jgi:hypothetical protein
MRNCVRQLAYYRGGSCINTTSCISCIDTRTIVGPLYIVITTKSNATVTGALFYGWDVGGTRQMNACLGSGKVLTLGNMFFS